MDSGVSSQVLIHAYCKTHGWKHDLVPRLLLQRTELRPREFSGFQVFREFFRFSVFSFLPAVDWYEGRGNILTFRLNPSPEP